MRLGKAAAGSHRCVNNTWMQPSASHNQTRNVNRHEQLQVKSGSTNLLLSGQLGSLRQRQVSIPADDPKIGFTSEKATNNTNEPAWDPAAVLTS